jgi:hypothetical protein
MPFAFREIHVVCKKRKIKNGINDAQNQSEEIKNTAPPRSLGISVLKSKSFIFMVLKPIN